jgi:four helix bundle protein
MATIKYFEELDLWKKADELNGKIYEISKRKAFFSDWTLKEQARSASLSIMNNIAEGFERDGNKEQINFLSIAKGSAGELRSMIHVAKREGYITEEEYRIIYEKALALGRMIYGFMSYLRKCGYKGDKFKKISGAAV